MATPLFPNDPKVLIDYDGERDAWLDERRKGIGGTDIGKIIGTSKYGTALEVWKSKTEDWEEEFSEAAQRRMKAGLMMENAILDWAADELGVQVEHSTLPQLMCDRDRPFMRASIDGAAWAPGEGGYPAAILDAKNVGGHHTESSLFEAYESQLIWYMGITGVHHAYICALLAGQDLLIVPVEWDGARCDWMVERAEEFWLECVVAGEIPTPEKFPPHNSITSRMWEGDPDLPQVNLEGPDGLRIATLAQEYRDMKKRERNVKSRLDEIQAEIKVEMGDAEYLSVNSTIAAKWGIVQSRKVNNDKLKEDYPEVYEDVAYTSTYRRFTVPTSAGSIKLEDLG